MKSLWTASAVLAALALVVPGASAQVQVQPKRVQIQPKPIQIAPKEARLVAPGAVVDNKLVLLENKAVQDELKLTAEQLKNVQEMATRFKEAIKALKPREAFQKSRELIQQNHQQLATLLNANQNQRLAQLEVQQKGPNAFFDPQISKEVNLTPEQRTEVQKIIRESAKKRTEITRENQGNPEKLQQKLGELNKSLVEQIVKGLTDGQRGTWKTLVGEPFKGTLPAAGAATTIRPLPGVINPPQIQPVPLPIRKQ